MPQVEKRGILSPCPGRRSISALSRGWTLPAFRAAGFTTSEPVASGDSYVGEFSKEQVKGVSYFSANGKLGSVITIMGASLDAGKKMLKDNLKPANSKLFPASF